MSVEAPSLPRPRAVPRGGKQLVAFWQVPKILVYLVGFIPAVWWFTGFHPDYHHTTDTVE